MASFAGQIRTTDGSEDGSTDEDEQMVRSVSGDASGSFAILDDDERYSAVSRSFDAMSPEKLLSGKNDPICEGVDDVITEIKDEHLAAKLNAFSQFCSAWVVDKGLASYSFATVVPASALFDFEHLKKEKDEFVVLVAVWVCFLRILKTNMSEPPHKYRDLSVFLSAYEGQFDNIDEEEQLKLMDTANWMAIVLPMVVAKKSKGLILHVVPKLLEGFGVKYVTGSGQSKRTSNRVSLFEHEGNVQPCKKRKWSASKEPLVRAPKLLKSPRKMSTVTPSLTPKAALVLADVTKHSIDHVAKDAFSSQEIEMFRRTSFYAGPSLLTRCWSEDFSHHFDIDIDELL